MIFIVLPSLLLKDAQVAYSIPLQDCFVLIWKSVLALQIKTQHAAWLSGCVRPNLKYDLNLSLAREHGSFRCKILSALLYIYMSKISTGETGRAFPFAPLPLIPCVKSPRTQHDLYRHPSGRPAPLSPLSVLQCATVYMTSLGKPHPLNLLYSIVWFQSNLLTLMREKPTPL